jgi:hypothetical protein
MSNIAMLHEKDPKEVLLEQVGDISKIEVFNMQVLVAVYIRPEKTKSGLFLSETRTVTSQKWASSSRRGRLRSSIRTENGSLASTSRKATGLCSARLTVGTSR